MTKCLIAEYETSAAAKVGLEDLEQAHFTLENVSVVSKASDPAAEHLSDLHDEKDHKSAERMTDGHATSLGMLIGGSVAAPIAAGTLIGPFIVAGPLVGMAVGAAIGGFLDSLDRWGVGHDISTDYEARVKSGSVLLIIHDVDEARLNDAESLLTETGPKSLARYEVS